MQDVLLFILFLLILFVCISLIGGIVYAIFKFVLKAYFGWTWRETFTIIVAVISSVVASQGTDELKSLIYNGETSLEKFKDAIAESLRVSSGDIIMEINSVDTTLIEHKKTLEDIQQKISVTKTDMQQLAKIVSLNQKMDSVLKFL